MVACLCLLVFNTLVAVTCLLLSPRGWIRVLCAMTGHLNTMIAASGVAAGAAGLLDVLRIDLIPYVEVYLVVLLQQAILRVISVRRFRDESALWWPG